MKKYAILILALILLFSLSACTRSKSKSPVASPTVSSVAPFPVATKSGGTTNIISITQTALSSAFTNPTPITIVTQIAATTSVGSLVEPTATYAPLEPSATPTHAGTAVTPPFIVFSGGNLGYPTFGIRGVVQDQNVTIQANEFPADVDYVIRMGDNNTGGVNGTIAEEANSGEGGTFLKTVKIPENLKGLGTIAVRIEFSTGTWAANYFYNITTN